MGCPAFLADTRPTSNVRSHELSSMTSTSVSSAQMLPGIRSSTGLSVDSALIGDDEDEQARRRHVPLCLGRIEA